MEGSRYSSNGAAIPHAVRLGPRIAYARAWQRLPPPPIGAAEAVEGELVGDNKQRIRVLGSQRRRLLATCSL